MTNSFKYWMRGTPGGTAPGTITCARTIYQFDEIFALLGANTAIHLGPGEFLTRGYGESAGGPQPKSGQKISGSGISVTTLKMVNAPRRSLGAWVTGNYSVIGTLAHGANVQFFEVSDLTLDCNLDGQLIGGQEFPLIACQGIMMSGAHLRYRRVRAINFRSLDDNL